MTRKHVMLAVVTVASLGGWGCDVLVSQAVSAPGTKPPIPSSVPASEAVVKPSPSPSPSLPPVDPTILPPGAKTQSDGLKYADITIGTGASPQQGQTCVVHYTGWLKEGGKKFESSLDRGQPFEFRLMTGSVIRGWDEGIATMKVGGKRKLEIPPKLAYGDDGANGVIPSNATLIFDIELLAIK